MRRVTEKNEIIEIQGKKATFITKKHGSEKMAKNKQRDGESIVELLPRFDNAGKRGVALLAKEENSHPDAQSQLIDYDPRVRKV